MSQEINPLVIRGDGGTERIRTNIKIRKPRKPRASKGTFSAEQKWRIYKSHVEPKLYDQLFTEEPKDLISSIKEAINESRAPDIHKLLENTEKTNDHLHTELITPNQIDSTPKQKSKDVETNEKNETIKAVGILGKLCPVFTSGASPP